MCGVANRLQLGFELAKSMTFLIASTSRICGTLHSIDDSGVTSENPCMSEQDRKNAMQEIVIISFILEIWDRGRLKTQKKRQTSRKKGPHSPSNCILHLDQRIRSTASCIRIGACSRHTWNTSEIFNRYSRLTARSESDLASAFQILDFQSRFES